MIPDHPDIRQTEIKGYIGSLPRYIGECEFCDSDITEDSEAYEASDGTLICGDMQCLMDHAMSDLTEI